MKTRTSRPDTKLVPNDDYAETMRGEGIAEEEESDLDTSIPHHSETSRAAKARKTQARFSDKSISNDKI